MDGYWSNVVCCDRARIIRLHRKSGLKCNSFACRFAAPEITKIPDFVGYFRNSLCSKYTGTEVEVTVLILVLLIVVFAGLDAQEQVSTRILDDGTTITRTYDPAGTIRTETIVLRSGRFKTTYFHNDGTPLTRNRR